MRVHDEEVQQGNLDEQTIREAVATFREEGVVILENCFPVDFIEKYHALFVDRLNEKIRRMGIKVIDEPPEAEAANYVPGSGGNHDYNRWNMRVPSTRALLCSEIVANPFASAVVRGILGSAALARGLCSDICFPNSIYQVPHRDGPNFGVHMNIPLVDIDENNGPTEIWPRTHIPPNGVFNTDPTRHKVKTREAPSRFLVAPRGSVVIRDPRALHRGTPNRSSAARPMLSFLYSADEHSDGRGVPYLPVSNLVENVWRSIRSRALKPGLKAQHIREILAFGNGGTGFVARARTDRLRERKIPRDVWEALNTDARHLLRYAHIVGERTEAYKRERSLMQTVALLRETAEAGLSYARMRTEQTLGLPGRRRPPVVKDMPARVPPQA